MKKIGAVDVIAIITFIELIASIVLPFVVINNGMELGAIIIGFVFVTLIIYYAIFIMFLSRYSKRKLEEQNIAVLIFLNLLPLIIYALLFTFG